MISAWNLKKTNAPLNSIDDKVSTELILLGVWKDGVTNMVCLRERSKLRREFNANSGCTCISGDECSMTIITDIGCTLLPLLSFE